jgi:glycosyltransferase involved in cell wall biosynthesis
MMRDLAVEYVRQGHQVIVATPSDAIEDAMSITVEDGVTLVRIKTGNLKYASKAFRMWRESRLSAIMWRGGGNFLQANPCDLILFYSPTIFFGNLVNRLKRIWGCPSYLILRDIFPKWAVDAGLIRKGLVYRYLRRKELLQYAAADLIGVEASGNLSYFRNELAGYDFPVEVLNNWLCARVLPASESDWRHRLGLSSKVIFFYGGNIGIVQDLDNILRLAAGMRDHEEVFFLFVGSGSEVIRLSSEIEKQGLHNVRILAPLSQSDYIKCLSECDVGLVSLDRRLTSHNLPGKLLGYVLCGKPVLASLNPGNDLIEFLRHADAGIACTNGEDGELLAAALLLAAQPETRRRMGNNARGLGNTIFSVQAIAQQILSHFVPGKRSSREGRAETLVSEASSRMYAD